MTEPGRIVLTWSARTRIGAFRPGISAVVITTSALEMRSETKVIDLVPGGTAAVKVKISRNNGFGGRVPVDVLNLPPRTLLPSFGLNGVLLNENETERTFEIAATPQAEPGEQYIVVGGRVETRSTQQNTFVAPEPILVRIRPRTASAQNTKSNSAATAQK